MSKKIKHVNKNDLFIIKIESRYLTIYFLSYNENKFKLSSFFIFFHFIFYFKISLKKDAN